MSDLKPLTPHQITNLYAFKFINDAYNLPQEEKAELEIRTIQERLVYVKLSSRDRYSSDRLESGGENIVNIMNALLQLGLVEVFEDTSLPAQACPSLRIVEPEIGE